VTAEPAAAARVTASAGSPIGADPTGPLPLPPGLHIAGAPAALARVWPALAPLQPVAWQADGLVCAPRAGGEQAGAALRRCPVPVTHLERVPGWPDPPAAWLGGWYLRSPGHAAAPPGVRELLVTPGEGFGPVGHVTTAMCLAALARLPRGPALDVGCGAGLLTQAWLRLGRGPVRAVDLDPGAVAHARACLAAAGLAGTAELRAAPAEALAPGVGGAVLLANLPLAGHLALDACMHAHPRAAVLSGLRPGQGRRVADLYRARGLRVQAVVRRGGWECWVMSG